MAVIEGTVKGSAQGRILVVDDDAGIRQLVGTILGEEGFEVEQAVDGVDALAKMATQAYDAVVSDLQMPRLDGLSLLREIRRRGIKVPVIIQTARVDASIEAVLHRAGAIRVLSKGPMEELLQSVGDVVGSSRHPTESGR
jgi:CheY-like chemotaxis protein